MHGIADRGAWEHGGSEMPPAGGEQTDSAEGDMGMGWSMEQELGHGAWAKRFYAKV